MADFPSVEDGRVMICICEANDRSRLMIEPDAEPEGDCVFANATIELSPPQKEKTFPSKLNDTTINRCLIRIK